MGISPALERRIVTYLPPLLIAALLIPFALRQNAWYEWQSAYWLLQRQAEHVSAHGVPTYFLHTREGSFYAFFAFYGGFTIGLLAYPAALFGAWPVFLASMAAAVVGGYLGVWWAARNLGLSRRLAVLPGLIYATTPYVLSDAYGRGAWAELVAVNAAAMMVGAWTALLGPTGRHRTLALGALVGSAAILAGTHNVTFLMAAAVLPLIVLALLPFSTAGLKRSAVLRSLGRGVMATVLGFGLTAAWLIPNLWLGPSTVIANVDINQIMITGLAPFQQLGNVLAPWPVVPDPFKNVMWIYAQAPVYAIGWVLVAFVVVMIGSRRRRPHGLAASSVALLAVGVGLLVVIVHPSWWLDFPSTVQTIQMPMRLLPFVAIVTALVVTLLLIGLRQRWAWRPLVGALVLAVAAQGLIAIFVVTSGEPGVATGAPVLGHGDIKVAEEPWPFSGGGGGGQLPPKQFRVLSEPEGKQKVVGDVAARLASQLTSGAATLRGTAKVGDRLLTDVVASPLVHVGGDAKAAGRDTNGLLLIEVTRTDTKRVFTATVREQCALCFSGAPGAPWQLRLGRLITLLSLALLATGCVVCVHRGRRARQPRAEVFDPRADVPADEQLPVSR
jgi:hypothetical protein